MIKQIAMVGILGLAIFLVTAAIYTQSAFAASIGGGQTPPGLTTACAHNPNCSQY